MFLAKTCNLLIKYFLYIKLAFSKLCNFKIRTNFTANHIRMNPSSCMKSSKLNSKQTNSNWEVKNFIKAAFASA